MSHNKAGALSAHRAIGKDAPSIEALRIYAVNAAFVAVLIAKE
jgi:hypothetical protein